MERILKEKENDPAEENVLLIRNLALIQEEPLPGVGFRRDQIYVQHGRLNFCIEELAIPSIIDSREGLL